MSKSQRKRSKRQHVPATLRALAESDRELGQIRRGEFPDERFVAFIDILGFRDILDRMFTNERELFTTVLEVLEYAKSFADVPDPENMQAITAFSDSVVITSGGPFGTAGLFATVRALAGEFLTRGILCRGGISRGRMYHADGILFGEGLVRAYDLERCMAHTPRILIADDVAPAIYYLIEDPIPRVKRDKDGKLFLNVYNYFWRNTDISSPDAIVGDRWGGSANEKGLLLARRGLLDALSRARTMNPPKPGVLEKVSWSVAQFNDTLQEIRTDAILPIPLDS